MRNEQLLNFPSNSSDVTLCAFALTDCIIEIDAQSAKYLRAVHRTALELAVPNLYGLEIGGFWLTREQLLQLRRLPEYYSLTESDFVSRAVEAYLHAQTRELQDPTLRKGPGSQNEYRTGAVATGSLLDYEE